MKGETKHGFYDRNGVDTTAYAVRVNAPYRNLILFPKKCKRRHQNGGASCCIYDSLTSLPVMCSGTRANTSVPGPARSISFCMYSSSSVNL